MTALDWLISKILVEVDRYDDDNNIIGVDYWNAYQGGTSLVEFIGKAKRLEREQHARTWDAAIKAHEKRGHVKARSFADFDDYEIK